MVGGRRDIGNVLRTPGPLAVGLGLLGSAFVVLAFVFARTGIPPWIPPAISVQLGVPSPLSGMTRSFVALARGDVVAAFGWHPLGPFVFAACVAAPVIAGISVARGSVPQGLARALSNRLTWLIVALLSLAAWIRQIVVLDV